MSELKYALGAMQVMEKHYGTPNPTLTYLPRIPVPTKERIEELKSKNKLSKKERIFSLMISDHGGKTPNSWMHQYDLWQDNKNIIDFLNPITTSTLSVSEYGELMSAALDESKIWLHDIEEIVK